ncbi:hypothetical protein EGR_07764 [Echinococcus granulosus]|uniref:Uncharacterized protein n=1 Tax=Echinococcus granulosus TaxID=6210 RepID=W6UA29_ECHGR|nr:hypothetical protein EGR_07764 [Echinococcus granulosus]EUB57371.1 hypothetical protein EGR_07764 [Echinococcus granulosus]
MEAVKMLEAGLEVSADSEELEELKAKTMYFQSTMAAKEEERQNAVKERYGTLPDDVKHFAVVATGGAPKCTVAEVSLDHMLCLVKEFISNGFASLDKRLILNAIATTTNSCIYRLSPQALSKALSAFHQIVISLPSSIL